jgi:hypothetical protein
MSSDGMSATMHFKAVGVALILALVGNGCGGTDPAKPKLAKVSGKVTYKGQPVTSGRVAFTPEASKGSSSGQVATGDIGSDGSFRLTTFDTNDGAVLGQHIITVQVLQGNENMGKPKPDGTFDYKLPKSVVPVKYTEADKSPLRYTVVEGTNNYEIELEDGSLERPKKKEATPTGGS